MEVGVHRADRAQQMIAAARRNGRTHISYFGFDLFSTWTEEVNVEERGKASPPLSVAEVQKKLQPEKGLKDIQLFQGNSRETLPQQAKSLPLMNVIFIDGGHSLETIRSDISHALPLLAPGGIIVLDDYYEDDRNSGCAEVLATLPDPWTWALASERDVFPQTVGAVRCVVLSQSEAAAKEVADSQDIKSHAGCHRSGPGVAGSGSDCADVPAVGVREDHVPEPVEDASERDSDFGGRRVTGLDGADDLGLATEPGDDGEDPSDTPIYEEPA
jgi:hypothetical protein